MTPYEYNGIVGYSKQQALSIIGCDRISYISRLMAKGKLEVVGEMPIPHMPHVTRKLLSVESVEEYAEVYESRNPLTHMYQVKLTQSQLEEVKRAFPELQFVDLTESRRIKRRGS